MESVILSSPVILLLLGIGVLLLILALVFRSGGYVFPILSVGCIVADVILSVIYGADYQEIMVFLMVYLLLLIGFIIFEQKKSENTEEKKE